MAASSARGRRPARKGVSTRKTSLDALSARQRKELAALAQLPDAAIDTRAIPETEVWKGGKRGLFYKPVKQQLTLRLDADVVEWFKRRAPAGGYQTRINSALREYMNGKARAR